MGTDIHLFVEYRPVGTEEYASLTASALNLPRDYALFGALAGVRADRSLIPPRGFPADASEDAHRGYYSLVSETLDTGCGLWSVTLPAHADSYVARGLSHRKRWGAIELVSEPDAHHASWLTAKELAEVLAHSGRDLTALALEYRAMIATLSVLVDRDSRIVFWFDN